MATPRRRRLQRKQYRLDAAKLQPTGMILETRTETETIHGAVTLVADERALVRALRDFVAKGGQHIQDVDARR